MQCGAFCISIDVERAWGVWDKPSREYFARCERTEAQIVDALISLFDRHRIPATWAIVARLLERDEARAGSPSLWHGPDTIERILSAREPQEVGSHSYAHVYYGGIDASSAALDLANAARVHREHQLDFRSFVFPRNDVAHVGELAAAGLKVFRSVDQGIHTHMRRRFGHLAGRAANLVDKALPIAPSTVLPIQHENGLVELPSSMLLMGRNGARRAIHPRVTEHKARLGLEAAASKRELFHLWFHPSNFYYDMRTQLDLLERIIVHARALRDKGTLSIRTMGSFAEQRSAA